MYRTVFDSGLDSASNGGYNLYEVFIDSYLSIWREYIDKGELPEAIYPHIKKDLMMNFLIAWNYRLLIKRDGVRKVDVKENGRKGWATDHAWSIMFHHYKWNWYFYYGLLKLPYMGLKDAVKKVLRRK